MVYSLSAFAVKLYFNYTVSFELLLIIQLNSNVVSELNKPFKKGLLLATLRVCLEHHPSYATGTILFQKFR